MEELMAIIFGLFGVAAASVYMVLFVVWFFFIIVSMLINLVLFVFWVIAIIDCIRRNNKDFAFGGENAKLIWILILVLVRSVSPLVYYLLIIQKKQKPKKKISRKNKK
ncbi:PLDc N-terminal domain-containing protein [Actinomycetota bacterium]